MKKIGYILALVLEIAALAGAYIIHYFTRRKLGMVRYLNFKNMTWERDCPMGPLKTGCVAVVAVLTVLVLLFFLKKRKETSRLVYAMNICMIVLTALYAGYTLGSSTETMTDYYFISILFLLAAAVQVIKTAIAVLTAKGQTEGAKGEK